MGNGESQVQEEEVPLHYQHGYQILKIQPNSPCDGKNLKIFFEFIIGVNGQSVNITNVDSFLDLLKRNANKPMKLTILDCKARHIREINTVPNLDWGSKQHLGINIRLCSTKLATSMVWHILEVYPNSPASMAGLETNNDYIIGTPSFIFSDDEDLFTLISSSVGKPLNFFVYNHLREDVRMVTITPNDNWGGAGCLGCDVGYGALHKLPGVSSESFTTEPNLIPLTPSSESQQPQQQEPQQPQEPQQQPQQQQGVVGKEQGKEEEKEGAVTIADLKEEEDEQEMLPPLAAPPSDPSFSSSPSLPSSLPLSSSPLLTEVDPSTYPNPLSPPLISPIPHQRSSTPEQPTTTTTSVEEKQQEEQKEEQNQNEKEKEPTPEEQPQQQPQQQQEQQQQPQLLQPSAHPPSKEGYDFSVGISHPPLTPTPTTNVTPTTIHDRLSSSLPLSNSSSPPLLPPPTTTSPTTPPVTPTSTPTTSTTPSRGTGGNPELENLQRKKKELEARLAMIKKGGSGGSPGGSGSGSGSGSGNGLSAETKAKMEARLAELRAKQQS